MIGVASIPCLVLVSAYIGFAGLARDSGVSAFEASFMTAVVWALPNQVVLVGAMVGGVSVFTAALAVTLTAVRLMPMVVTLVPLLRSGGAPRWQILILSQWIAVTSWVVAQTRLPKLPPEARAPYFFGFAVTLATVVVTATGVAHATIGHLPDKIAGGLYFLTPIYFLVSIWGTSRLPSDRLAMLIGLVLGPVLYVYAPGPDLMLSGLGGGTAAYLIGRAMRRRAHE